MIEKSDISKLLSFTSSMASCLVAKTKFPTRFIPFQVTSMVNYNDKKKHSWFIILKIKKGTKDVYPPDKKTLNPNTH